MMFPRPETNVLSICCLVHLFLPRDVCYRILFATLDDPAACFFPAFCLATGQWIPVNVIRQKQTLELLFLYILDALIGNVGSFRP